MGKRRKAHGQTAIRTALSTFSIVALLTATANWAFADTKRINLSNPLDSYTVVQEVDGDPAVRGGRLLLPNGSLSVSGIEGTYDPSVGTVDDTAYNATSWDGVTNVAPSKNAVRDKFESLGGGGFDSTALNDLTWSDGASASVAHTFAVTGTDPVWTYSNGVANLSAGVIQQGGSPAVLDSDIGVTVQDYDADLDTWSGVTPSANGQSLVSAANYAAMRTLLDLEAGTDFYSKSAADAAFQPLEATLTDIADGTIAENLVNTANPWADNEVADNITLTNLSQVSDATEAVQDIAGALIAAGTGTHTGITVTYQDVTGDVDLVVDHDAATNFVANEHIDWTGVDFLVGTATGLTSNEIVAGTTPGGELGGTWGSPTIDDSLSVTNWTLTTPTISGAITFPDNTRQTFNPGADAAGLNVGSHASDPGTPSNGDLWYDSTANELTARINGANVALGAGGGYTNLTSFVDQTAWRLFYSNTDGDVTELAFGTSGQVLTSNGATAAPTFETVSGGSGDSVSVNSTAIDTTANFLDNIYIDFAPTDGGAGGPDDITAKPNYNVATGDHALSANELAFAANGFVVEGATADTIETYVQFGDPASSDKTITFFNATDTVVGKATTDTLTNKTIDGDNNTISNLVIGAEVTGASTALTDTADILYVADQNAGTDVTADLEEEVTEGSLADQTIVSADIKEGTILYGDLSLDAAAADGDYLTLDTTGTNFAPLSVDEVQTDLSVDDLVTLSGVSEGAANLGTFTGATISDNGTIKAGMQELETALELVGGALAEHIAGASWDGGGSAIASPAIIYKRVPFACTITGVVILGTTSGSATIDVWKDTYANYPPTDADTITASAVPATSSGVKYQDETLTGWTTSVSAGDIIGFNVDSTSGHTVMSIEIYGTRT